MGNRGSSVSPNECSAGVMDLIESFFKENNDLSLKRYMCQTLADSIPVIKDQWAGMDDETKALWTPNDNDAIVDWIRYRVLTKYHYVTSKWNSAENIIIIKSHTGIVSRKKVGRLPSLRKNEFIAEMETLHVKNYSVEDKDGIITFKIDFNGQEQIIPNTQQPQQPQPSYKRQKLDVNDT